MRSLVSVALACALSVTGTARAKLLHFYWDPVTQYTSGSTISDTTNLRYRISYATSAPGPYTTLVDTTSNATNISATVSDGSAYYYASQAYLSGNEASISAFSTAYLDNTILVTPSAGSNGTILPSVTIGASPASILSFTVTPNAGYTASVGGTCGGSLVGTTYTTNAITANCTVVTSFCKKLSVPASLVATGLTPNPPSNATLSFDWADVNSHTDSSALSGDLANYWLHWGTTSGGPYNTASSSPSAISVGPTQANITYYARVGAESSLNAVCNSDLSSEISFYADTVPPVLSGLGPSGSLAKDTTSATLSATTSESATCRYGDKGTSWSSRTTFSTTGSTAHSSSIPVWAGLVKRVCTLCRDALGNESSDGCTSFSVNAKPKRGQVN